MTNPAPTIELQPITLGEPEQAGHLRRKIVCRRPFREGGVRLEAEDFKGKHVVHCYGHGGSGWTLAPGCGRRISSILEQRLAGDWSSCKGGRVTVVGAGVIGLFAAYYLSQQDGIGEIQLVAEQLEDLTSHNAGGLFEPFAISAEPDYPLLADSYEFYHSIALNEGGDADFDAVDIELLSMFSNERTVMPSLVDRGYIPDGLPATVVINGRQQRQFVHQVFFLDVSILMKHLFNSVTKRGVKVIRGIKLESLAQVESDLVINCSGLGARQLAEDPAVRPVTGHLIRLHGQPRALMDIDHNLHAMISQREELLELVQGVVHEPWPGRLENMVARHMQGANSLLQPRYICDKGGELLTQRLLDAGAELTRRLQSGEVAEDPDVAGLQRIRLFDSQAQRNRFIDALALMMRIARQENEADLIEVLTRLYAAYLPRYSKRYVMLLEQEFPAALTTGNCGKAISYFMPVLHEPVYREAGGHFHYHSDPRLDQSGAVGCCGGTSIDREDLSLGEHEQEFDNVVGRLRHLGFR